MRFAIVDYDRSIPNKEPNDNDSFKNRLWRSTVAGLQSLGHTTEYLALEAWDRLTMPCDADVFIFWNGQKKWRKTLREFVESNGKQTICVEHGWFGRERYFHFSLSGHFGPFAHFTKELGTQAVTSYQIDRMAAIVGMFVDDIAVVNTPVPMIPSVTTVLRKAKAIEIILGESDDYSKTGLAKMGVKELRKIATEIVGLSTQARVNRSKSNNNSILLIEQVAGDAQHGDINYDPVEWTQKTLQTLDSIGNTSKIIIRTHPRGVTHTIDSYACPESQLGLVEVHGGKEVPLSDDLHYARYVLTYNSNVVHDALVAGIPCMVTGPHLAGVYPPIIIGPPDKGREELDKITLLQMQDGWHPKRDDVINYLARLCDRQWNYKEIAGGGRINSLLTELAEMQRE